MPKSILGLATLVLLSNTASAMCVMVGDFFITNNKTSLENLHVKHEKYQDAYSVPLDEKGKEKIEDFCKKISCTKTIKKMRGCSDITLYTIKQ